MYTNSMLEEVIKIDHLDHFNVGNVQNFYSFTVWNICKLFDSVFSDVL